MNHRPTQKSAVIIGGGFSGLATAALLAKEGIKVTLLEKNATLGGRARVLKSKGFSFDMGPSWYLMPEVFERYFAQFGKKVSDYYQLIELNTRYKVFFDDNTSVLISNNAKKTDQWFEKEEKGSSKKIEQLLQSLKLPYIASTDHLMYANIWDWKTWIQPQVFPQILSLITNVRLWESWYGFVSRFVKSEKIKKILSFSSVFLGGSPFSTPSLYSILLWADFKKGVWYPKKGIGQIVSALETLAQEQGVEIITNCDVTHVHVSNGKVQGVSAGKRYWNADIVVGAGDLFDLETRLLPEKYQTFPKSYWEKKTLSISAMMMYVGLNKKISSAQHHSMYFSKDWSKNFSEIYQEKKLPEDPSFYISIRSKSDNTLVPPGCEELVVLVPLAAEANVSEKQLKTYGDKVLTKLEELFQEPLKENIVVKKIYGPKDFQSDYHAYRGNALGLAHTFLQSLWLRPNNQSKKVQGLYYAGQYTNPGVGVPTTLVSAHIVSQMILKSLPKNQENEKIFKKGSVTYYYSSLFFRGQVKKDVSSLYAYVRVVDDFVDRQKPQITQLEAMWKETLRAWEGKPTNNHVVKAFVEMAKRKELEWSWIESFWKAMRQDITKKEYRSFAELEEYMYGSAEVIGLMMAQILNLPPSARKAAALQGKAMQLLNFIRDVQEDEQLGRNYLGIAHKVKMDSAEWSVFLQAHIQKYRKIQKEAEKGYHFIPKKYLVPIKTAADMYNWTATRIEQDPGLVWTQKMKPHKRRVLLQLAYNALRLT